MMAQRTDVRTSVASDAYEHQFSLDTKNFHLLDGADAQQAFYRTSPGWALVDPAGKFRCNLINAPPVYFVMQTHQAHVLFIVF
jgi:hypothetical protein